MWNTVREEQILILHKTPGDLKVQVQDIVSAIAKAWNHMSHRLHQYVKKTTEK